MMNAEGAFARLLELIQAMRKEDMLGEAGLHRLLMDLLYEMSRIQRVKIEDLGMLGLRAQYWGIADSALKCSWMMILSGVFLI